MAIIKQILFSAGVFALATFAEAGKKDGPVKTGHIVGQHPPTYTCPDGFDRQDMHDGKVGCFRDVTTLPLRRCTDGIMKGDDCVTFAPLLYSCPAGYFATDGEKEHYKKFGHGHDIQYEYTDDSWDGHHGHKVSGDKNKHSIIRSCARIVNSPFEQVCPDNTPVGHDGCPWTKSVPTYNICPIQSNSHHGGKGKDDFDKCLEYDPVNPLRTCPKGYVLDDHKGYCIGVQKSICPREEKKSSEPLCIGAGCGHSKGAAFHLDASHPQLRYLGKKHGDKKDVVSISKEPIRYCEEQVVVPSQQVCPPGSLETSSDKHFKDGKHESIMVCVVARKVPLVPYCPIPNGIMDASGTRCYINGHHEPLNQCPAGFDPCSKHHGHHHHHSDLDSIHAGDCCRVELGKPLSSCPPGFTPYNDRCIAHHPFEYFCQKGQELQNGVCLITESAPPKIEYAIKIEAKGKTIAPLHHAEPISVMLEDEDIKKKKHHNGHHH